MAVFVLSQLEFKCKAFYCYFYDAEQVLCFGILSDQFLPTYDSRFDCSVSNRLLLIVSEHLSIELPAPLFQNSTKLLPYY